MRPKPKFHAFEVVPGALSGLLERIYAQGGNQIEFVKDNGETVIVLVSQIDSYPHGIKQIREYELENQNTI